MFYAEEFMLYMEEEKIISTSSHPAFLIIDITKHTYRNGPR